MEERKAAYTKPTADVVLFQTRDVISTSGDDYTDPHIFTL